MDNDKYSNKLNSNCKNAINLQDFKDNIEITIKDLLYTTEKGYVEGLTNIIITKLKNLETNKKPFYCTNKTKSEFYIKSENVWQKDTADHIDKFIDFVTKKQIDMIKVWTDENIEWVETEAGSELYLNIIQQVMGGGTDELRNKNKKNIKRNIGVETSLKDII